MNELKKSDFNLPVSPFLDNAINWYLSSHTNCYDDNDFLYSKYQDWMSEQGVVIKNRGLRTTDDGRFLNFVDEQSMIIFILRWGN